MRTTDPTDDTVQSEGWAEVEALVFDQRGQAHPLPTRERVAEEAAIAMVYNGVSHAVMLATPLDLEDFALGFSLTEGIIDAPSDLLDWDVRTGESGTTLDLRLTLRCFMRLKERRRTLAGRTGCGVCGAESLADAVRPVRAPVAASDLRPGAVQRAMIALEARQPLQQATGATHAAAWCTPDGEVRVVREDIGRHNALDKLIGAVAGEAMPGRWPLRDGFIAVTSRASYEMVHKTATAGVGLLAAISAPTALAVRTAEAAGLTLVGFARGERAVCYSHGHALRLPV